MNRWQGKHVIGLTGNICAGKSEVCALLVELGAYHVDADAVAHYIIAKGTTEFVKVVTEFGEGVLSANGEIDRGRLGDIVFSDRRALARLEEIVHPGIEGEIERIISDADHSHIVLEAIKLLESSLADDCDTIWVVTAAPKERMRRLIARDGLDEATAQHRLDIQAAEEEKLSLADVVIDNNGRLQETLVQVHSAWGKITVLS